MRLRGLRFTRMPAAARDEAAQGTSSVFCTSPRGVGTLNSGMHHGRWRPGGLPLRTALLYSFSSGLIVLNLLPGKSYPAAMRDYHSFPESYRFSEGSCKEAKVVSMEKNPVLGTSGLEL